MKASLDNSGVSDVVLAASGKRALSENNKPKKRKSVSFGENSTLEFTPSKYEMKRKMNAEARRKRRMKQRVGCGH